MSPEQQHVSIIRAPKGWHLGSLKEMNEYRDLLYYLVSRDIKIRYKQSALGVSWALIQPVFSMIVFTVIFGSLVKMSSDGVPYALFSYAALVPWTYFSNAVSDSSNSLIANSGIISKIYFPRLIIPITPALAKLLDFAIALGLLGVLMIWFGVTPTINAFFLPLLVAIMAVAASGIGMFLSALAIQYRDVKFGVSFAVQILMYASPVVYPVSKIPDDYRLLYAINPMVGVIEGFRSALLGTVPMPWDLIGVGAIVAVVIALVSAFYFQRMEARFADVA